MIGENELVLCEGALMDMVQRALNADFTHPPLVTRVVIEPHEYQRNELGRLRVTLSWPHDGVAEVPAL